MGVLNAIDAPLHGARAGKAPMTRGQRAIGKSIRRLGDGAHHFNTCRIVPIPVGHDNTSVLTAVGDPLLRHEVLRTVFHDGTNAPVRKAARDGTVCVPLSEAPVTTGDAAARRLSRTLTATASDLAAERPVRSALVTEQASPVGLVMILLHLSVDGWVLCELIAGLRELFDRNTPDTPGRRPLDQTRHKSGRLGLLLMSPKHHLRRPRAPDVVRFHESLRFSPVRRDRPGRHPGRGRPGVRRRTRRIDLLQRRTYERPYGASAAAAMIPTRCGGSSAGPAPGSSDPGGSRTPCPSFTPPRPRTPAFCPS